MIRQLLSALALAAAPVAVLSAPALAQTGPSSQEFLDLAWSDLLPEGEARRIAELQQMQAVASGIDHFGVERMPQIQTFNTVDALDGERVRIGGYVLPFDFNGGEISRFLLVPYVGACIHVPPPPPNQLVYVTTSEPIEIDGLWDPVYAEGIMRTKRQDNELGDTAYTLELDTLRPYEP
ncbi:MAG: DUF3299 domain-containing protein [Oceanicaulis sp.]